MKYLFLFKKIT